MRACACILAVKTPVAHLGNIIIVRRDNNKPAAAKQRSHTAGSSLGALIRAHMPVPKSVFSSSICFCDFFFFYVLFFTISQSDCYHERTHWHVEIPSIFDRPPIVLIPCPLACMWYARPSVITIYRYTRFAVYAIVRVSTYQFMTPTCSQTLNLSNGLTHGRLLGF